jgi:hypothetical protein
MSYTLKYIEDENGNKVLPITHFSAVKDSNGDSLEDVLYTESTYDPTVYSGMGRKVLQKNMVSGVNTLTQSMMSSTNTIYIIRYDFTLGSDITVPANCILEFDGGSISASGNNDTITGNNTCIKAQPIKIFSTDINFAGSWNVVESYIEWFAATAVFVEVERRQVGLGIAHSELYYQLRAITGLRAWIVNHR